MEKPLKSSYYRVIREHILQPKTEHSFLFMILLFHAVVYGSFNLPSLYTAKKGGNYIADG
jgi:hypothetical protein